MPSFHLQRGGHQLNWRISWASGISSARWRRSVLTAARSGAASRLALSKELLEHFKYRAVAAARADGCSSLA